ncbi:hypothetical protein Pcac1_g29485 [Phytophthora cactorum]|nr:hypothetical protein Pcac1_g29485 [Phytophthora cactorum]
MLVECPTDASDTASRLGDSWAALWTGPLQCTEFVERLVDSVLAVVAGGAWRPLAVLSALLRAAGTPSRLAGMSSLSTALTLPSTSAVVRR